MRFFLTLLLSFSLITVQLGYTSNIYAQDDSPGVSGSPSPQPGGTPQSSDPNQDRYEKLQQDEGYVSMLVMITAVVALPLIFFAGCFILLTANGMNREGVLTGAREYQQCSS